MKIQPIMDDQFAAYYSDLTTTSPDHVKFENNYTTDSLVDERASKAGWVTGDLDYPAAKTLNVLNPVVKKRRSGSFEVPKHPSSSFEKTTANRVFTKELVSSNIKRTEDLAKYGISTFDEDMRECHMVEKVNRLKAEGNHENRDNKNSKSALPKVRFSSITIQEYSVQPGVNPGGTKGCPLTIGWEPISSETLDLDVFEEVRGAHRRTLEQLKLVSAHREQVLLDMGYTMKAVIAGTKAANQARRSRYSTIARLHASNTEEMLEGLRNNVQNIVTFGNKKRREQKFLAPYVEETKPITTKAKFTPTPRVFVE